VSAPDAIKEAVTFKQIVGEFTVTSGNGFTVIVEVAELVQPGPLVPVTV
jgi:hypothetical protein